MKKVPLNMKNKEHFTLGQLREAGDMLLNQGKLDEADGMTNDDNFLALFSQLSNNYFFLILLYLYRNVYEGFRSL